MRNKQLGRIEDVCFFVTIAFVSFVITLGFVALVSKMVMYVFE